MYDRQSYKEYAFGKPAFRAASIAPSVVFEGLVLDDKTNVQSVVGHANVTCTAITSGTIVVDSISSCAIEAREIIAAGLGAEDMIEVGRLAEEREITMKKRDAYTKLGDVSVFKSVGVGAQDVVIARYVVSKAEELGFGKIVEDFHV
ncbi:hypothetical protein F5J12DRAFT_915744 [Pisolithus orientalis]|uniref:uncharacterized protein n=1 Tax=Pisolithus orientalis TaxID=936130 RepID=UPI002224AA23|nr:uncharacterized protein F5J12DRAFT_915744 [Pisolithus orientalis]KAI5990318.1 hypothetical protein F5J12DRAFT_915744 [Pisolithus orientalis]